MIQPHMVPTFVHCYRHIEHQLREFVAEAYPHGSVVYVEADRFRGYGIVARTELCEADALPVLVESGNVWHYELTSIVYRDRDVKRWPRWIREHKLRRKLLQQRLLRNMDEVVP